MSSSSLVLRAYQEEAVQKAFVAKKGTIKAATGTGKTLVAIAWLEKIGKNSLKELEKHPDDVFHPLQ